MQFEVNAGVEVLERTPRDLGQVARVMAKQYRDAVGPWRAYLPVMDR